MLERRQRDTEGDERRQGGPEVERELVRGSLAETKHLRLVRSFGGHELEILDGGDRDAPTKVEHEGADLLVPLRFLVHVP